MEHIVVIDDDQAVTSVLRRGLTLEGFVVSTAEDGERGLELIREQAPDLVILDVMMPGLDGLSVLERLRAAEERAPVVLLTARDAPADQVRGLDAGADDYVIKPFTFEVLLARVRAQLRRQRTDQPHLLRFADLSADLETHEVRRGERQITLTALEFRVLVAFLQHPRQVLSKEQLLERIWGYDFGGNGNVVEVYIKQLRQKLEVEGEPRLLHTLRNVGYVLREE